jgi:hypothetical protein
MCRIQQFVINSYYLSNPNIPAITKGIPQYNTKKAPYFSKETLCKFPFSVKKYGMKIQIGINLPQVILGLKLANKPNICLTALTQRYRPIAKNGNPIIRTKMFICDSVIVLLTYNAAITGGNEVGFSVLFKHTKTYAVDVR